MNKVIIAGHPYSAYEEVEELLRICGMSYANQSIREGFTPQQITGTLCKAYGISLSENYKDIEQIDVGAVWHSMVLDLMLANIDHSFWGWSDPNVIYLLNFWKSVDPKIVFILVYDKPESVFAKPYSLEKNHIKESLNAYSAYNTELLNFYRQNQDRCFLVHAQQVRLSAASYIQQLKIRIGKNLKFPNKIVWKGTEISCPEETPKRTARNKKINRENEMFMQTMQITENSKVVSLPSDNPSDNPLARYIAKALTHNNRQSVKVYKELQESANLPLVNEGVDGIAAIDAWQSMVEQVYKSQMQAEQIQNLTEQLNRAEQNAQEKEHLLEHEINKIKVEHEEAKSHIETLKNEQSKQLEKIVEQSKKTDDVEKQKAALSQNLQQTEKSAKEKAEQLEQLKKQLEESKKIVAQAKELEIKNKELQAVSTPQNSALEQENEMLLSQLHQIQEELERYYLENQELKKNVGFGVPKLYGAKERVKNSLEYHIGAALIEHWKSGKLTLLSAVKKVQKEHKNSENLPPLENYADACEGYKIQKHLSYRLGATWLNHKNILTLPRAILKDVREFREGKI
ncbi:MAG: hypothetical protein LBT96_04530 [Campylobacteraceae bacterium]|jgi:hypothetical protein|nr:hypothetical protein [Campylobacteraceae bacterium]